MPGTAGVLAALEHVESVLQGAGLQASVESAEVNLPGCWVWVDTISPELLNLDGTVQVKIQLVVPNTTDRDAIALLDQLLYVVTGAGWPVVPPIQPESVVLPSSPQTPLPSYGVIVTLPYTRTETP